MNQRDAAWTLENASHTLSSLELVQLQAALDAPGQEELVVTGAAQRRGVRACTASLLARVGDFIRRFVILSATDAVAITLWVLHTYAFGAADYTPYLNVTSPEKRCGKSRLLDVLELVVAKPWKVDAVTVAALVRRIEKDQPTLLFDESDSAFGRTKEYAQELRGILNAGFRTGGKKTMVVGEGARMDVRDFAVYCPKAIAGIGNLPDTVADRSIRIRLQRKASTDAVERLRMRLIKGTADALVADLRSWSGDAVTSLVNAQPDLPSALNDRAADVWEPLLAIADLAGQNWADKARRAAVELSAGADAEDISLGSRLLADISSVFDESGADRISSSDLVRGLAAIETSPWAEIKHDKPLTPTGLAQLLHPFGLRPRQMKIAGVNERGYERSAFANAIARYVPASTALNAMGATTPVQSGSPPDPEPLPRSHGSAAYPVANTDSIGQVAPVALHAAFAAGHEELPLDQALDCEPETFVQEAIAWRDGVIRLGVADQTTTA